MWLGPHGPSLGACILMIVDSPDYKSLVVPEDHRRSSQTLQ